MAEVADLGNPIPAVRTLETVARRAEIRIIDEHCSFEKIGREQAPLPLVIANLSIEIYQVLTGKRATANNNSITNKRESKFISFLSEIYEALGITASAGSNAQTALKAIRQKTTA